jgi:hypothetical protein
MGAMHAQAPPAQPAQPAQQRPARPAPAAATPTVTIQVTNSSGLPLANVQVTAQGPVSREGVSAEDGSIRFANMRAGAYRLRFVRESFTTLDRDITVRAGEPLLVDVALSSAPAAPKPVEPAPSAAPVGGADKPLGPPAEPKLVAIPTFIEKNFIGREGRKDSPLGCTSTGGATLVQLREALLNQTHEDVDEWVYVVAGEGTLRLGTAEQHLQAGTFALIPHTVAHGLLPVGRNPLIFVSVLSGYKTC